MKTEPTFRRIVVTLSVGTLALLAAPALIDCDAHAAELPRYKLQVGQELTYRTPEVPKADQPPVDDAKTKRVRPQVVETYIITVTALNNDGSWRLNFRNNQKYGNIDSWNGGYFDLAPDGRIVNAGTLAVTADPLSLFPPLPHDASATSWTGTAPLDEVRRPCQAASLPAAGDAEWSFVEDHQSVFTPIYEMSEQRDYVFDVQKGLIKQATRHLKAGWPARRVDKEQTLTVALAETRQLDSAELAAIKADMEKYYAAKAEHDAIESKKTFKNTAEISTQALAPYRALEGKLQTTFFKQTLAEQVDQAERFGKYELESAERFVKLLDQPSQDWQTTDLDGNPRSLADYRGKVVLLDFWYRGCGWCIRAMPQFKQLVDDFANQPVAILGMNNDKNLDDAKFVIDKMGLNYTTLKNGEGDEAINKKYGVQGWPTLVVLDGQGVIRHIHVGFSPNLRKELGEKIRELLANQQAAK